MTSDIPSMRRCLLAAVAGAVLFGSGSAYAQEVRYPPGAVVQPLPDRDSSAELRRHLGVLADNPRSLSALVGAGRSALELGDAQAALAFFARADEIAPRDARVKAGMGSALVQLEQGQAAVRFFAEAAELGAPAVEIAGDRGLAYDMIGDQARAQQDYRLVLAARDDPEVRRRLALSLAISGQREPALATIREQLERQDRAAWRTRAFVLALTGDAAGASQAATSMMSANAAAALSPFLQRLPTLTPAQRAMAVHFGRFPAGGPVQVPSAPQGAYTANVPVQPVGPAAPRPQAPAPRASPPAAAQPAPRLQPEGQAVTPRVGPPAATGSAEQPQRQAQAATPGAASPGRQPPSQPTTTARPAAPVRPGFADVAAVVAELPPETRPVRTAPAQAAPAQRRPATQGPSAQRITPSDRVEAAEARRPQPRQTVQQSPQEQHPSRHWVQVAGGAEVNALPREFARLRERAPRLLGQRDAYTVPVRYTNRLLVGPFPSVEAAQQFVNQLAQANVTAFTWTSPAGQEIERLPAR